MIDDFYYNNLKDAFNNTDVKEKTLEFLDMYKSNADDSNWYIECWLRDQTLPSPDTIKYNKASIVMTYNVYGHEHPVTVTLNSTKNSTFVEE